MASFNEEDDVEFELEEVEVGSYTFEITTVAHLPIEKLMNNHAKGVEISGQKVWCGSLSVSQYLINNKQLVADAVVVELGAGTGVLGMVCQKLGCKRLILTDNDAQSLIHMQSDCPRNGVQADIRALDWFDHDVAVKQVEQELDPESKLIIVAGDVLYKHMLVDPFFSTVFRLLQLKSQSMMFLCHVPRAGVEQDEVVRAATTHGLRIEPIHDVSCRTEENLRYCPEEDLSRSQVYRIQLEEQALVT